MIKRTGNPRREFIGQCVRAGGVLFAGLLLWVGCGKKQETAEAQPEGEDNVKSCDDLSAVSEKDRAIRAKLGYVEESPLADNQCHNCNLYFPPKEGKTCGGCMLFKGPVFADAYCTYWAPKV